MNEARVNLCRSKIIKTINLRRRGSAGVYGWTAESQVYEPELVMM